MRVGIVGIMHESNTFIQSPTTLENFRNDLLLTGSDIRPAMINAHHEIAGFFEALENAGVEPVPLLFARALPSGPIAAVTLQVLLQMLWEQLDNAGDLDGILTAPHGANVCLEHPDMDGYWLTALRQRVGQSMPIVSTLDPHANLSPAMVTSVNAIIAYRMNPHLDQKERGIEAANLLLRTMAGEIKPVMRSACPRMAINIEKQSPQISPCLPLYELASEMRGRPSVLSTSITLGFPYSDVQELGSALIAVTDNDPALAQQLADEMAAYLVTHREQFAGSFTSPEQAVAQAMRSSGPVCLLDMGDNVGGGSPGDSPILAHTIETYCRQNPIPDGQSINTFISLFDQPSASAARKAGIGAIHTLDLGGKQHALYGPPLRTSVKVISLHDGHFTETKVRHYGMTDFHMGPTAIVQTPTGLTLQLTSERVYPTSLNQVLSCGLDPASFQILVAKGVHAPVAAYEPVCKQIIRVNTPGVTCADMTQLPFMNRRRPLFPFESDRR